MYNNNSWTIFKNYTLILQSILRIYLEKKSPVWIENKPEYLRFLFQVVAYSVN